MSLWLFSVYYSRDYYELIMIFFFSVESWMLSGWSQTAVALHNQINIFILFIIFSP